MESACALVGKVQSWWAFIVAALKPLWEFVSSDMKAITDIVIALFTVVLAVATVQLARATNVLADDTRKNSRQREIQSALSIATSLISNMRVAARGIGPDGRLSEEAMAALNECESIAYMARMGVYDLSIVERYVGPNVAFRFDRVQPAIAAMRRDHNLVGLYSELEWLVSKMKLSVQKS
jgi:hypothetical protein